MRQHSNVFTEFPDDLKAIRKLRSMDLVFNEICEDLEVMGQEIALLTEEQRLSTQGVFLDVNDSYRALRQELAEYLRKKGNTTTECQ